MSYVTEIFSAGLTQALEADAVALPVSSGALADLVKLLEEDGSYTFASIKSDSTFETVRLYLSSDTLVMDRGQAGTSAVKHPCGSLVCLVSPTVVAAVKALICEYDCCEDTDCVCEAVAYAGAALPAATVDSEWEGHVLFSGAQPITLAVSDAPSWMTVTVEGGVVTLAGTPTESGTFTFLLGAANCNGTNVVVQSLSVVVS